ncbi:kremen protein 2-like [Saccostrea cucullata]|uniref:kremen protein 2-like n=1 Tax=Saccostrea cuccullata TaxID=36930 RepID=UPI002ED31DDD
MLTIIFLSISIEADRVKRGATRLAVNCGSVQKFSYSSDCSESYLGTCVYKEYLGCFEDKPKRTLSGSSRHDDSELTVESCRKFCADYQFYGVEFGKECFCRNFFTSFIKKPECECNVKCSGNKTQTCGDFYRINIYSNANYETEIKTNWTSSMQICKTRTPSSYLIGNVSLTDATLACKQLQRKKRGPSWLSIAKEMYSGYDRAVL